MQVRLIEPKGRNWILVAEGLNDPEGWTRFLPCHTHDSERFLFETTVKSIDSSIQLAVCKDMLSAGVCPFEYDWNTDEEALLEHAVKVAERLQLELLLGDDQPIRPTSKAAA